MKIEENERLNGIIEQPNRTPVMCKKLEIGVVSHLSKMITRCNAGGIRKLARNFYKS